MTAAPSRVPAQTLARAVRALGAPVGVDRLLLCGASAAFGRAIVAELEPQTSVSVATAEEAEGRHDLIVITQDLEAGPLHAVRERLSALVDRLAPEGLLVIYPSTLAAPVKVEKSDPPDRHFDALLFPEAAASGDMGHYLATAARLSASTWLLLIRSLGLSLVAQAGQGEQVLPAALTFDHEARLAVFDPAELNTGRLLLLLRAPA